MNPLQRLRLGLHQTLPERSLSWLARCATRWRWGPWKNLLIAAAVKGFRIDLSEAQEPDSSAYAHFDAFFTRALRDGARPQPQDPQLLSCPADGCISQCGTIRDGLLLQAKGHHFALAELLADADLAAQLEGGWFATIYLSPRDYHRYHMPCDGHLLRTSHVPGRLFSVQPFTTEHIRALFARNERYVCEFDGTHGRFAVALVAAVMVSGIETVFDGLITPPYARDVQQRQRGDEQIRLKRGDELGRFHMGSTVILAMPRGFQPRPELVAGQPVRVGQALGQFIS